MIKMVGKKDKEKLLKAKGTESPKPEATSEVARSLAKYMHPLMEQLNNFKEQMSTMTQCITSHQTQINETLQIMKQNTEKVNDVVAVTQKVKKKVQKLERKQSSTEDQLLQLQMEKANMILRFQGMPENKGENLKEVMSELLAPVTKMKAEFSKRHVRDAILKAVSGISLKLGENTIRVLKDIPFEVRQRRKKYKELVLFLQTTSIGYKWLFPEGVTFKIKDKKEKIDSVMIAQEFLRVQLGKSEDGKKEEDSKSSGELDSGSSEEDSLAEQGAAAPKSPYKLRKRREKEK